MEWTNFTELKLMSNLAKCGLFGKSIISREFLSKSVDAYLEGPILFWGSDNIFDATIEFKDERGSMTKQLRKGFKTEEEAIAWIESEVCK